VLAYNSISGNADKITEQFLDPASRLNGQGAGHGKPPSVHNLKTPTCSTMAPQAPHKVRNSSDVPLHYYRIEYKRIDGEALTDNWRKWYPWMQHMQYMR
jgi:hypothetical protein